MARYEEAIPAKMQLLPNSLQMDALRVDYQAMKKMMFGKSPSFEEILTELTKLETEIHKLG